MSKLLRLKNTVTLDEAARHLTKILEEPVDQADVVQLALDGNLTISVSIINTVAGQRMRMVDHVESETVPGIPAPGLPPYEVEIRAGLLLPNGKFLVKDGPIDSLTGCFDLPMIGGEVVTVENIYYSLRNGPESGWSCLDGSFVRGREGVIYQLQDRLDPQTDVDDCFYPRALLPDDSMLVIRTDELLRFARELSEPAEVAPAPATGDDLDNGIAAMNADRAIAVMAWLLSENRQAMQISGRPNAARIGKAVSDLASNAFGDDTHGLTAFHKRVSSALKAFGRTGTPSAEN